ncbi:hypothetical protein GUG12_10955, partial [Xanthomonas citri pv. citri]|nr:hypothetical protein [Xanthomonas citri pv. citri]
DLEIQEKAKIKDERKGWNETSFLSSNEKVDDFIETEVSSSSQFHQTADLPNPDSINSEEKLKESVKLQEKGQVNSG